MGIATRLALITVLAAAAACMSSSNEDSSQSAPWSPGPNARRYDEIELARETIGPGGGVVHAQGLVLTVPPGAVATATPIVVKTVALFGEPVLPGKLAGRVYRLEPEGLRFAVPITVAAEPDRGIIPADARGAIVLFSSPHRRHLWAARGAATISDHVVAAQSDALSDWAPVLVAPTGCGEPTCGVPAGATDASVDCRVPAAGNGVRCTGTAPPYACVCDGQPGVSLAAGSAPTQDVLSVFAFACGADCGGGADADASTDGATDATADGVADATLDAATDGMTDGDAGASDAAMDVEDSG